MDLIKEYKNVLGKTFCQLIIDKFETNKNILPGETLGGLDIKTKLTYDLHSDEWVGEGWNIIYIVLKDMLHSYIYKYYDDIGNLFSHYPKTQDSGFQIQKYNKNEGFYKFHNDFTIDKRGFRTLAYIFYLNDIQEGGETEFYEGTKIKPETGKLLIFPSLWTYPHKGNIPISNDKYIVTGWIYSNY